MPGTGLQVDALEDLSLCASHMLSRRCGILVESWKMKWR